jgi:hypothetical protein
VLTASSLQGQSWRRHHRFSAFLALRQALKYKRGVTLPPSWSNISRARHVTGHTSDGVQKHHTSHITSSHHPGCTFPSNARLHFPKQCKVCMWLAALSQAMQGVHVAALGRLTKGVSCCSQGVMLQAGCDVWLARYGVLQARCVVLQARCDALLARCDLVQARCDVSQARCDVLRQGVMCCRQGVMYCEQGVMYCEQGVMYCKQGVMYCRQGQAEW